MLKQNFVLNGTLVEKGAYNALAQKALEWASKGVLISQTTESTITLYVGTENKTFPTIVASTRGNSNCCVEIFVKLGDNKTLLLGQFGNDQRAPLYIIEQKEVRA